MKRIILLAMLLPSLGLVDEESEFYEKHYFKNFAGWQGITFMCSYDESNKTLRKICERGKTDLELLSASHNVNLKVIRDNEDATLTLTASLDNLIVLEYDLEATNPVEAVHARLIFSSYYLESVEQGATPGSIDNLPRSGNLEIWSNSAIGSGTPSNIVIPFSDGAESMFKKAITLFLKYNEN